MSVATNMDKRSNKMKEEFLKAIEVHQAIIYKIVSFYARNGEDKKDLFQEILLELWKSYHSFQHRSSFSTWTYRVALNTALLSQRKKRIGFETIEASGLENAKSADPNKAQRILSLYIAIDQLRPLDRAITLLYLEQKTYLEIADILDINKDNVGVRVHRIKQKLKTVLTYERKL